MRSLAKNLSCVRLFQAALLLGSVALAAPHPVAADNTPNAFNPHTGKELPSSRMPQGQGAEILAKLGGKPRSIATDAAYRKHWREEVYPVIWGSRNAPHEVLVLLDFASPASRPLWQAVSQAVARTSPDRAKVVLFGKSAELFATDLTGMAIWAARERPKQAMEFVSWALKRWDEVKAAQKRNGTLKQFRSEYDAVATRKDQPMTFVAMKRFKPGVPEQQQVGVADYSYEAGNINLFQTNEVCAYYGVRKMPALVVDGKVHTKISAEQLASLLK